MHVKIRKIQISSCFPSFVEAKRSRIGFQRVKETIAHAGVPDAERGTSFIMSHSDFERQTDLRNAFLMLL